jgi:DNA (cytosine-5)-methyltransferase 1
MIPARAIQGAATRENPESGPDGIGVSSAGAAYTLEARSEVQAVAHSLRADGFDASEDGTGRGTPLVPEGWRVRRLTPRECERLQGFPDDFTLVPFRNKPASDGPRYKAMGNSMAVNVMRWIGQRIELVDRMDNQFGELG